VFCPVGNPEIRIISLEILRPWLYSPNGNFEKAINATAVALSLQ
jgi:hypothetical protein